MRLVVNTNRIIAALIRNSASRRIIMSGRFELVTAQFADAELRRHRAEILDKALISGAEYDRLHSIFFKKIYAVDDSLLKSRERQARMIMDPIDPDDSPFIALALLVKNDGIWSDDEHFTRQKQIRVWKTKNLIKYVM